MASQLHLTNSLSVLALGGSVLLAGCVAESYSTRERGDDATTSERVDESEQAVSTTEQRWKSYLTGSKITHTTDFMAGGMNNTLISNYFLCTNGRYVHQNEI